MAGFLIELVRAPIAIVFDAVSYLGAALFVGSHPPTESRRRSRTTRPTGPRPSMWQEARAGSATSSTNRYLRNIAACTGTFNLFGNIGGAILILYLVRELGLDPGTIGLIFALGNIGVLLGALLSERVGRLDRHRPDHRRVAFFSSFSLRGRHRSARGADAVPDRGRKPDSDA